MSVKSTTEEFIIKANNIHKNKYDYYLTDYKNSKLKVKINCVKHGIFEQTPNVHLMGAGCPKCGLINIGNKRKLSTDEFIERAKIVHENKYDYSNTIYVTARNKINIICPQHGIFYQKPHDHLYGNGCQKCVGLNNKTTDEFIDESKKIFGNIFDYSKTNYITSRSYVTITCKIHGDFKITPNNHLSKKQGCFVCRESKGEKKISEILNKLNVEFVQEKTFQNCMGKKRKLPFDFYLPKQNLVIEYDGRHHFEIINNFGGKNGFETIQRNDKLKDKFLNENNINLLRIPYYQYNNIETILSEKIL